MCVLASTLHNLSPFSSHFSGAWPVLIDDFVEHMYRFDIPQHTRHQYSIVYVKCLLWLICNPLFGQKQTPFLQGLMLRIARTELLLTCSVVYNLSPISNFN